MEYIEILILLMGTTPILTWQMKESYVLLMEELANLVRGEPLPDPQG